MVVPGSDFEMSPIIDWYGTVGDSSGYGGRLAKLGAVVEHR